jgi:hypothetical protein
MRSRNGINWDTELYTNFSVRSISYSNQLNRFVAVGSLLNFTYAYSTDAITWFTNNIPTLSSGEITYVEEFSKFLVWGLNQIITSSNGIDWDPVVNFSGNVIPLGYHSKLGQYLFSVDSNEISYTNDFINFTTI